MKKGEKADKEKEKLEKERLKAEKEKEKEAEKERKKAEKEGKHRTVSKVNVSPNASPAPSIIPRDPPREVSTNSLNTPSSTPHSTSPSVSSSSKSVDDIKPTLLAGSDATTPRAVSPTPAVATTSTTSSSSDDPNVKLLKSKLSALPDETKLLVDYLLALFSRAAPPSSSVHGHQLPNFGDQADIMVNKLVEASEILFNKDHSAMLKKHIKELLESPHRRGDKWRTWVTLLNSDVNFAPLLMSSNALDATVRSSVMGPVDEEEKDVLGYILKQTVIPEIEYEHLLSVLKAFSHSHEVSQENVDGAKTVSDLVADFFECFKKNQDAQYKADHQRYLDSEANNKHKDEHLKKGEVDPAVGTNMSFHLLHHASIVTHAKTGNDASKPLEHFFVAEIAKEEQKGVHLQQVSTSAKTERAKKVGELESQIQDEDTKLQHVKSEIKDLEAQLLKKRGEESALQANHAQKLEQLERLQDDENQKERDISTKVHANRTLLENHKKSLESLRKFDIDVKNLLETQIGEAITNSQEMIVELEKEVQFLEEKMASYERSITLFSSDEPEVLDGLKKLFARSSAVYAESKMSSMRQKTVVELLESVLSTLEMPKESQVVHEVAAALGKIIHRQTTLNEKYKLQA